MVGFAINPPLHVRGKPDIVIRSTEEAAEFVRSFVLSRDDPIAAGMSARLSSIGDLETAQEVANEFRTWLEQRHLLLMPPDPGPPPHID